MMQRWSFRTVVAVMVLLVVQGCGFELRGIHSLPASISPLYIEGVKRNNELTEALTSQLNSAGVVVTQERKAASAILRLSDYNSERRVVALNKKGKVAEYELHEGLRFALLDRSGAELISSQQVNILQSYVNPEDRVLGKQLEEDSLRQDMRRDLAGQIIRRLETQLIQ
jgi:LPS-assembly lipoprotein